MYLGLYFSLVGLSSRIVVTKVHIFAFSYGRYRARDISTLFVFHGLSLLSVAGGAGKMRACRRCCRWPVYLCKSLAFPLHVSLRFFSAFRDVSLSLSPPSPPFSPSPSLSFLLSSSSSLFRSLEIISRSRADSQAKSRTPSVFVLDVIWRK